MGKLFILIFFVASCMSVHSSETEGKSLLKSGKRELDKKQFQGAIGHLSAAEREFPLLGDYALLWLSDAYHETNNHGEALKTVRTLLKKYPRSPLSQKARIREITEGQELEENVFKLFEAYLEDYPNDADTKYLFAQWLKKNGEEEKAETLFKDIYIAAGPFSMAAYEEFSASYITANDMVRRASNLINRMHYKSAESALRGALAEDDGTLEKEIFRSLGLTLFRQKKYQEAAEIYKKVNDRYWEVRSLYRSGQKDVIAAAMDDLLKSKDRRIGSILTAVAADKRREGNTDEAVRLYRKIIDRYPSDKEDALWGIGWTYFLNGDYREAHEVFARLYSSYGNRKYLYWKARSLEASGEEATDLYSALLNNKRDFYSLMTYKKIKAGGGKLAKDQSKIFKSVIPAGTISQKKNDRIEALTDLGFSREALSELIRLSKNMSSMEDVVYACSKFQEFGSYDYSVRLAKKLPLMESLHQFLYPRAYWPKVEGLAERYDIDPFLVLAIVREESRFDADARSVAGALGLMQLMPKTAYRLDNRLGLGIDNSYEILNVKNNLHLGTYYLSSLVKEFGSYTYAIAAYNAGEKIVKKWRKQKRYRSTDEFIEDIPYEETRNYVKRVLTSLFEYKRISSAGDDAIEISIEKL
ncbi:MAG: tetratricopeptide repeat protein [Nitrospirales bacterium]|nr:MAG: tetratricopeptide repeat protein [Nitrospirales bacterium]